MSLIDLDAAHVAEFPEYSEILSAHRLAVNSDPEELFVDQRFENKEECVFAIKQYSMNISVDYNVAILLLAVAQDGNRNVLLIAFAIVDKENMES
ncbi:hypothetical protein J1N35_010819 [Gossypium stocksii]|uniref:Uncharacterized protein n=1 Tax=Gossypium stocksii TaxID=47602 RepID=A0A9D3W134_9ROSI|nr:hypothetical protein J1N35_010819 [Gossypium stocksii]